MLLKKILLTLVFAWFILAVAYSQTGLIKGSVFEDATNEPLPYVMIYADGTTLGTTSDLNGNFSLELPVGNYTVKVSFISYQTIIIEDLEIEAGMVQVFDNLRLVENTISLEDFVVSATQVRTTEAALQSLKRKSAVMMDGISSMKIQQIGDANAVEAAKRVTGVTIEDGKYVYIRGLGDRYSKTSLNGVDIPGLDPDKNSLQMDIFPTNLINNLMVSKNFTADLPADFTGGLLNIETKDLPDKRIVSVSVSTAYNPDVNLNNDFLAYNGGGTDFLGFDDGTRALPSGADSRNIPSPFSGHSQEDVTSFIKSFNPTLGAERQTSYLDFSAGFSLGNQINLNKDGTKKDNPKLGYIFSFSYKSDYDFYSDYSYGDYQRWEDDSRYNLRYATKQSGEIGERNTLVGLLGGLAYKTDYKKIRLTLMHLQNGSDRAGVFSIDNDGAAVGQSGYTAMSNNLEYNQRSVSNLLLNGQHKFLDSGWDVDWRISPTYSISKDPDIRKTAFTNKVSSSQFDSGAGGNPTRIWRSLSELNTSGKLDVKKTYSYNDADAVLKFGLSNSYKFRNYEILSYDMQFWGTQAWSNTDPNSVLNDINLYPNRPNGIYYSSGNADPNPNAYSSNSNTAALYVSNEMELVPRLKTILGLRAESFVLRHTGRDQQYASGDRNGKNLDNEVVLESIDLFPSLNFIYAVSNKQNLRLAYGRTIARPSFKELSYAQILDPITNSIFNGGLYEYPDWDGNLVETRIDNMDLRWEVFLKNGQMFSFSSFYKHFDKPIELIRIPTAQTSTEYQARNVGDGSLFGIEFEFRKDLDFIAPMLKHFNLNGNFTWVESQVEMTESEYNSKKNFERDGETIENVRQMAGQSPYVINAGLSYDNYDKGINAGFFYNVKGPSLAIVGTGLSPDIYVAPFHSLNFSFNKQLGKAKKITLQLKASNLLDDKRYEYFESYNADKETSVEYSVGRSFSIGFSYKL